MMASSLFTALRWAVTALYTMALVFSFLWAMDGKGIPFPFAAVALTVVYGILMTLLWLYERYPTRWTA